MVVLFKKRIWISRYGRFSWIFLDLPAFRLVTVYTPTGARQPDFFRRLPCPLGMCCSLKLVSDLNAVVEARVDRV